MSFQKKYRVFFFIITFFLLGNNVSHARENIVDYFLNNPNAWDDTKRITHSTPLKIVVSEGLEGLGFELENITEGDKVALVFVDTKKAEKFERKGFCDASDKLRKGNNRIVAVIARNSGDRTRFHYKFLLQRNINNVPVTIYNNGIAVLESIYDGNLPVKDISNLSGIKLCEIDIQ
ncbi:MAG: hypothetical protein FJ264_07230 [Planctomycetes bacterium]|nr:hypothetical protein [Planctomycetota bacterium]